MNEQRASGLILRVRPFSETSVIIHWLTPELGRLATIAKGARRPKSPFRGMLDLFHELEFSFVRSRRSDLHTLREAVLRRSHPHLRVDLARLQQAAYAATLLEQNTETETPIPGLVPLLYGFLDHIDQHPPGPLPVLAFEIKLLQDLGLSPLAARPSLSSAAHDLLHSLARADWPAVARLQPPAGAARELARFLSSFLVRHFERVPRGRPAALAEA